MKKLLFTLIVAAGFTTLAFFPENESWMDKVDPELLAKVGGGASAEFLVILKQQADLEGGLPESRKEDKGKYVYDQLRHTARRSQQSLKTMLLSEGVPHRAFFIINAFWLKGDYDLMRRLAQRGDVAALQYNPPMTFHSPIPETEAVNLRDGVEWGIQRIKADKVWELGVRGQNVVVAGGDTGYDWTHPTLSGKYRGNVSGVVDHDYNWHDAIHEINPIHGDTLITPELNPCGLNSLVPCDDHGHGTHTMGTMVGDDGLGNQIGVAPDARWIACRNMERGYGSPATYIECFEFFLAPTDINGNNPNPALAPHVINNSWGCPPMEGCNPDNFGTMDKVVKALKTAGIVVVASAGNSGSKCSTVDDPAAIFADVFSVGAIRPNDSIASFSSRGPVAVDSSFRIKPDIAAPGVSVRSALPDSSFATWSGTSMAGPHVAGVVALMISANPNLAGQVDRIENIIRETAKPMTDTVSCNLLPLDAVPNHAYGSGRIDAYLAVQKALELTSVDPVLNKVRVAVFPNPARETVNLTVDGFQGVVSMELFDPAGKKIMDRSFNISSPDQVENIRLDRLSPGIYFYRVVQGETSVSGKIVVK